MLTSICRCNQSFLFHYFSCAAFTIVELTIPSTSSFSCKNINAVCWATVQVFVGQNLNYTVGQVQYSTSTTSDFITSTAFPIVVAVAGTAAVILILIIIIILCVWRRYLRNITFHKWYRSKHVLFTSIWYTPGFQWTRAGSPVWGNWW